MESKAIEICPLMSIAGIIASGGPCWCGREKCGFWMAAAGKCSVPVIAGALDDISEK